MAVATCLLSVPLTVWIVRRAPAARSALPTADATRATEGRAPVALVEPPDDLTAASDGAGAPAGPDRTAEAGAPPLVGEGVRAATPPASPEVTAHPPAEPARPHDAAPLRDSIAARLETRVRGDLRRLAGLEAGPNSPMGRVTHLFTFLEQQQPCAGGACQAAQRATEAYLRARAALLRDLLDAFLASAGEDDGAREHQALQTLHADFQAEMSALAPNVPMLVGLPEVLASTLRVPDYLAVSVDTPTARQ